MLRLKRSRHVKTGRTQARPWRIERRMGKLETLGFLGVWARRPLPKSVGSSRTKIKWVDQPQASNPFEIIHIRDTNSESFPTRWSQNRIGQAHFSLLTECDCLVWLGRNRRLSKDYEYCMQSSVTAKKYRN